MIARRWSQPLVAGAATSPFGRPPCRVGRLVGTMSPLDAGPDIPVWVGLVEGSVAPVVTLDACHAGLDRAGAPAAPFSTQMNGRITHEDGQGPKVARLVCPPR